jgi:hypothetical protein
LSVEIEYAERGRMDYLLAIAADDKNLQLKNFNETECFYILKVQGGKVETIGKRSVNSASCEIQEERCSGSGRGCSLGTNGKGKRDTSLRIQLISDCRGVLCREISSFAKRQLSRKAISFFDVNKDGKEALEKIIVYFEKIDYHEHMTRSPTIPNSIS